MERSTALINIKNPKFIPKLKIQKPNKEVKPLQSYIPNPINWAEEPYDSSKSKIMQCNNTNFTINFKPYQNYKDIQTHKNEDNSLSMICKYKKQVKEVKNTSTSQNRWTKEEDEQLMQIINRIGAKQWRQVASLMKTKTAKQCRDHYTNCLDPDIKSSYWSNDEEKILLSKYEQFGPHWSLIKNYLPGRTTLMIKNYVKMLLKKNNDIKQFDCVSVLNSSSDKDQNDFDSSSEDTKEIHPNELAVYDINYLLNRPLTTNAYV